MRFALYAALLLTFNCVTATGLARCDDVRRGGGICARIGEPFAIRIGETAYVADTLSLHPRQRHSGGLAMSARRGLRVGGQRPRRAHGAGWA